MPELLQITPHPVAQSAWVRLLRIAERQWGVISRAQLLQCGVSGSAVSKWVAAGRLHRIYPGVYAIGHRALSVEGRLAAALLYAGPGAALSHATAAWWWAFLSALPRVIHVRTPRRVRSRPGLKIHHTEHLERVWVRGFPVTRVAQTLLDLAATCEFSVLRRAVAEADYLRKLDLNALNDVLGQGRRGSAALRKTLRRHRPEYARTLSPLEDLFLDVCQRHRIPLPEVNVEVEGFMVDALWREQRVIAETDGGAAHGTAAQMERDRERDLVLRTAGYVVLRYSRHQLIYDARRVAADMRAAGLGAPPPGPADRRLT